MTEKELTKLHDLKALEVSLVKEGANLKKRFPVIKQENNNMNKEILKAVLESEVDEEAKLTEWTQKAKVSEKGALAAQAVLRILSSFKDELSSETLNAVSKAAGFEFPPKKEDEDEDEKKKKAKEKAKVLKPKEGEEEDDEMKKKVKKELDVPKEIQAHFEAVTKAQDERIEALTVQNEKVEKALKVEKDTRRLEHWVTKSKEDLEFVSNKTPQELAATFKKLEDVDPELAESHFKEMKTMSETVEKSVLFQEMGGLGLTAGSSMEKIQKGAEAYQKKSKENMSDEVAMDEFLQTSEGQKLYSEHEAEKGN